MKDLKVMIYGLLAMAVLLLLTCCSTTSMLCSVPEADGSVICKLSEKINTTPEAISRSLKVANAGGLALKVYEAQEAEAFIDKIIAEVEKYRAMGEAISYKEAIDYIIEKKKALSIKVQAVFEVIDTSLLSQNLIDMPLTDYDFKLFLGHLEDQKRLISVVKIFAWMKIMAHIV